MPETLRRAERSDDRRVRVVVASPRAWWSGPEWPARSRWRLEAQRAERTSGCRPGEDVMLLLHAEDGEGVLVAGAVAATLAPGADEGALLDQAAGGAAAALRQRLRAEKRQRLPDQLISFFHALDEARSEDCVHHALAEHALRVVGGHTALALVRDPRRGMLRAPAGCEGHRCGILWDERLARPGLVLSADARAGGSAAFAAPLFGDPATALVAHVPVGEDAVLALTERRDERIFESEDWDVLRAMTLQAGMALRRLRLMESVRSLSLTDPLTGLANRRHMEVVLQHAWSAACRGEPLALMMIDLDGLKAVNDAEGHLAGDRLLREVAEALHGEARGSDVVVRYGGDEFLVILPGGDEAGARAVLERVRARLDGRATLSAGIAVHTREAESAEQLVRDADRRLYDTRVRRRASAPGR